MDLADYSHKLEVIVTDTGAQSVSNREYEKDYKIKKTNKILLTTILGAFEDEFRKLIRR